MHSELRTDRDRVDPRIYSGTVTVLTKIGKSGRIVSSFCKYNFFSGVILIITAGRIGSAHFLILFSDVSGRVQFSAGQMGSGQENWTQAQH